MENCATALVTDNLTYVESYQAFERPPDALALNSLIPRGIRRFAIASATAVKPVNDQIVMFITATLPLNFAYILTRFSLEHTDTRASDWDTNASLRLFEAGLGADAENAIVPLVLFGAAAAPINARLTAGPADLSNFKGPFWTKRGGALSVRVEMVNMVNTVTLGGSVISHMEFLEYDLSQAQRHYINSPIPVLSR